VAIILLFLQPPMILTNHLHFSRAVDSSMMDLRFESSANDARARFLGIRPAPLTHTHN
jgi:hypothetical protein